MQRPTLTRFALAAAVLMFGAQLAHAANAQPIPMEAENRAKMARLKLKTGTVSRSSFGEKKNATKGEDECSIQVGNVDTGGSSRRAPREVNIFVQEPIFQVNNRCR